MPVPRSQGWSASVSCPDTDTEVSLSLELGVTQLQIRHSDEAAEWRWSFSAGVVAGGSGMPMRADEVQGLEFDPGLAPQLIYFASDTAGVIEVAGVTVRQ